MSAYDERVDELQQKYEEVKNQKPKTPKIPPLNFSRLWENQILSQIILDSAGDELYETSNEAIGSSDASSVIYPDSLNTHKACEMPGLDLSNLKGEDY